ncbi:hypothetical protein A3H66_03220 [Candidatus Falkowbacteria bacterium RIFCSPLOWO2_02_FULL_45_21]|uniref:Uncharacterized protein n=1 Tax=Candidatus Falkowbacteria bacterium RIFCSPLOWO2_02_FULL_45_21 TaxID=1797989 RepID=A0A1F5SCQ5_9BACT|nr:MAG: hypothetical protein A3H66_03220 [Candidatus Falkowbacteria bacterium RIFCSPLOWO2_02_FULL_45_21]
MVIYERKKQGYLPAQLSLFFSFLYFQVVFRQLADYLFNKFFAVWLQTASWRIKFGPGKL